jgi:catechol 2,3-dioxygenase-like lactoylglutathione lyase family enzyme
MAKTMITDIHHFSIAVSDMERSLNFYVGLLGMQVTSDRQVKEPFIKTMTGMPQAHLRIVHLQAYGKRVELIQYLSPKGKPLDTRTCDVGSAHIAFIVDDMERSYEELSKKRVKFRSKPIEIANGPYQGGKAVYFQDPDGINLELVQPPK